MRNHRRITALLLAGDFFLLSLPVCAHEKIVWTEQEKPIVEQIRELRKLDDTRAQVT